MNENCVGGSDIFATVVVGSVVCPGEVQGLLGRLPWQLVTVSYWR